MIQSVQSVTCESIAAASSIYAESWDALAWSAGAVCVSVMIAWASFVAGAMWSKWADEPSTYATERAEIEATPWRDKRKDDPHRFDHINDDKPEPGEVDPW